MEHKFVVSFNKKLTDHLNGLEIRDKVRFPTEKDANNWIKDVSNTDVGHSYSDFKIEKLNV